MKEPCICYNCFKERDSQEGPCPYCGFDLSENVKKYPVALRAGTISLAGCWDREASASPTWPGMRA